MWRDILIILAFVFAGLTYFGLTPGRLSEYAKTAKVEIAAKNRLQKAALFLMIALTLIYISIVIWRYGTFELADFLTGIAVFILAWYIVLSNVWKLSERGEKVLNVVVLSVFLPSLIASIILSDMLLWQKFTYPLGGAGVGFGLRRLTDYVGAKLKRRRSSKETNNSSTTTK